MKVEYDDYYQTENLFGKPYAELIDFFSNIKKKGKLLDLGCGQGRDAIPLAKLGYEVTGIDNSKIGIQQLNQIAKKEALPIIGIVADIYSYSDFKVFDFILLDSMFHFGKKEKTTEIAFLNRIISETKPQTIITICIQNIGEKAVILNSVISANDDLRIIHQVELVYIFRDKSSNHSSKTPYKMITIQKN
ncbi:MAG: methyltransferase domain-containing protein [Saprospiraceae bacterium]